MRTRKGRYVFPAYHPKRDRNAIARLAREELWRCADLRNIHAAEKAFNRLVLYYQIQKKKLVVEGCSLEELKQVFCDEFENNVAIVRRQRNLLNGIGVFVCALIGVTLLLVVLLLVLSHRVIQ